MDLLKRVLVWFACGFGLGAGVLTAVWLGSQFEMRSARSFVDNPPQVHVSDVSLVSFTKDMVVRGVLSNTGPSTYDGATLRVSLVRDGKVIYECSAYNGSKIVPGASASFQAHCSGLARTDIPADSSVSVSVVRATLARGSGT